MPKTPTAFIAIGSGYHQAPGAKVQMSYHKELGKDGIKMKVLIVYAHPNPESFNAAVLEHIKRGLTETSHNFTVIDLYQEGFDPVLRFDAERKRRDLCQDPATEKYRELVRQADHLIFIYPIWWSGPPAILKGFIDRVFVSEFAYTYEGNLPKGLLKNKTAWVVYTADSPGWYISLIRCNTEWTTMKRAVLKFCGFGKIERLMFAGLKHSDRGKREKWLTDLYNRARTLG
ncbi:general stress protein 14 [Peptococcaceae bacterium CEB3]|nr:general stress protein 14 [Peptococcaceae bacterium CEB3]